mgnify:CR=1 FL=1
MSTQKAPIWQAVDQLKEQVVSLTLKVEELNKPASVVQINPISPVVPAVTTNVNGVTNSPNYYPIPPDFVETVDLVLNKNFSVKLEPLKDSPAFIFTIVVPPKYSPLKDVEGPNGTRITQEDIRTKVIPFSEGVNGVRLWSERVFNNFDKDTQFRIVEDRPFAQRPI